VTDAKAWERKVRGVDCPMDAPRPDVSDAWDRIAKLSISSLYLAMNQTYRGQCVLIFDPRHAARPDELTAQEWAAFCADLYAAQGAVMRALRPDHINIESLGNVVPHLHWHVVPRYVGDARWGAPIWLTSIGDMLETRLEPGDRAALVETLREALSG
jgi:diadenosine tetraphosphate (Ap4A) HIT family hydrolase